MNNRFVRIFILTLTILLIVSFYSLSKKNSLLLQVQLSNSAEQERNTLLSCKSEEDIEFDNYKYRIDNLPKTKKVYKQNSFWLRLKNEDSANNIIITAKNELIDNNTTQTNSDPVIIKKSDNNEENKTSNISYGSNIKSNIQNVNLDEYTLLAHLIESEAGDEPYAGKLGVGSVIINRAKFKGISLKDVIFAKSQFNGVETKWFFTEPCEESKKAAYQSLQGINVIPNAYYFADLRLCNPEFAHTANFIKRIGNHWFFTRERNAMPNNW